MNKKVNIEYAYPYGLLKAAVWEMPQINFRLIDIESWANIDCIWNEIHQKTLNSNIYDNRSFAVVYHDEKRFYEVLHKKFILKSGAGSIQFSENGVYIITGGLGGIGMLIAEFLLERGAVNIALFTRTDQKQITEKYADQLQKINRWKEDGANILLIKTDVTVKDEVHDAVVYLRQTFSNIIGIFHCAVESQGGTIADTSYKDYMRKMNAKVEGANYLDEFTKEDSIEFFVLFSSAITTIGGYGSAAYITSNQYLLGLAEKMRIQGRNVTVIQWPAWLNTGIADRNIILPERELFFPLLPHEAIWVLENILISRVNSSIAGRINRNSLVFTLSEQLPFMIEKTNSVRQDDLDTITKKNINLTGRDDGHYSFEENSIACIWADFLGADQIDIDSNFFELGGDSISAIRITNQIKAEWQGIFEVRDFLSNPTVRKQAVLLRNMQCENKQAEAASILNNELEENIYPASSAQRRMFIHNYMNPESMVYNLPEVIEINGIVQVTRLLDVLYTILNTHDIFSTELRLQDNDVFQVLHNREFNVQVKDISERQLDDEINSFIRPFQLDKLENFRCTILRLSPDRHVLLYDIHHALFDGVSRSIFFRSLVQGYSGGEIIKPKAQYKDYAIYQDRAKQFSKTLLSQKDYWVKKIKKSLSSIDLIPNIIQFNENKGNRLIFYMESELLDKVNVFVQQTASTFFIFLLAVYSMIRYKVTRRQISVVATPVEGRPDKKFESTMGMFVNTLVLINKVDEKLCFMDYYKQIYENTISDLSNQDYQFDDLISDLKLSRNYGQFPLFDTMLVLQDKTFSTNFTGNGIQIKSREIKVNQIKFPSILEVIRLDDRVEFHFDYCQTIIKDETAKEICKWIIELSDAIIRDPNICLNALLKSCKKDKPMIGIDNFEF